MDIELENVNENEVFETKGPQVEFTFEDKGQANVAMLFALDDGTHFNYPTSGGKVTVGSTTLPSRVYFAAVTIVAMELAGGRTYKSKVSINGRVVATASGTIPEGVKTDQATRVFQLRVKK